MARIDPLSESEQDWIAAQLRQARGFVAQFAGVSGGDELPSLEALDAAWSGWLNSGETDVQRINDAINAFGVAFGQWLVDAGTLRWVIATDEHGTDLAVHGLPGAGDVLVYPANFVAKRYERREMRFFQRSYDDILAHVQAIHHSVPAADPPKPWWKRLLGG